jgi:hypothetical protein
MLVGGGALHAPPALLRGAPPLFDFGLTQKSGPYSQYQSYLQTSGLNALWIQGAASWTQYAAVPIGSSLKLIGAASPGGYGLLYETNPDGTSDKKAITSTHTTR